MTHKFVELRHALPTFQRPHFELKLIIKEYCKVRYSRMSATASYAGNLSGTAVERPALMPPRRLVLLEYQAAHGRATFINAKQMW